MSSDQTLPSDLGPTAGLAGRRRPGRETQANTYTLVIQSSGSDARYHEAFRQPPYWHEVLPKAAVHVCR